MNRDRWASIERIFHSALGVEPGLRPLYLRQACGPDNDLQAEVETLLAADCEATAYLRRVVHANVASLEHEAEFTGTERFVVQRRIGAGGFGIVYQVYDRHRDAVLALKTIRYATAEALSDFKREFRSLADIAHRNLVTLYELISEDGLWFFTMEYVDGVSFLDCVRGLSDFDRLRNALSQLAEGVSYLHSAGKLHCDLKPQNVLVDRQGRVAVLDFGLISESNPDLSTIQAKIAGTPDYLAPERAAGMPARCENDWYSVGVMLFQALTGRLPFKGDVRSVLWAKQTAEAPDPAAIAPDAPRELTSLCRDLLNRDPGLRPTGPAILERLGSAGTTIATQTVVPQGTTLIGRGQPLSILHHALASAVEGHTTAVYIHGAGGVGKTALVRYFLDHILDRGGVTLLEGRCDERESVPFKAIDRLIDHLNQALKRFSPDELKALFPPDTAALCRIFPVLQPTATLAGIDSQLRDVPEPKELRMRAFGAMHELIARLAAVKPLVLFVDDLHWGDLDSAPLLTEVIRANALRVLFIGCFRDDEKETSPFLQVLLRAPPGKELDRIFDLSLSELSEDDTRQIAISLLPSDSTGSQATVIARESGGNPFYVIELVNYFLRTGSTGRQSLDLQHLVKSRLSLLSAQAKGLFEVVAVAGQPVQIGIAVSAAELQSGGYAEITLLRTQRLIRILTAGSVEQIEIYHDRLREISNASMSADARREKHYRLAMAWEASGQPDVRALARHFYDAAVPGKAFPYAIQAGDQAMGALAFDNAARFYQMALAVEPPDHPDKLSLRTKVGDALSAAGRGGASAEAYLIASQGTTGLQQLELRRRAATQFMFSGRLEEGFQLSRDVLGAIGMKIAPSPFRALVSFFLTRGLIRLRGLKFHERREDQIPAYELFRFDTCMSLVQALAMVDTIRAHPFYAKALLLALQLGEPGRIAKALCAEAGYYAIAGAHYRNKAEDVLQMAQALAQKSGSHHSLGMVSTAQGMAAFLRGDWKCAADRMERAEALLRHFCTGVAWEIATAHMMGSVSLYLMGHLRELGRRMPRMLKDAETRGDLFEATDLRTRLSHTLALADDDVAKAHSELNAALREWGRDEFDLQHWWALIARIEIELYAGRAREAWDRVNSEWRRLRGSFLMRVQYVEIESLHHRARAALALAAGVRGQSDRRRLLLVVEQDAKKILRHNVLWGNGLAELLRAGAAAVRQDRSDALAFLRSGCKSCGAADMELYAAAGRCAQGQLIGGDEGRAMIESAEAWMKHQGIRNSARIMAMLVPGFELCAAKTPSEGSWISDQVLH